MTVRTELVLLRACLNLKFGRASTKMWIPPASPPRDRHLTKEQLNTLLESIDTPHVRLFVILAVATGARMTAILQAKWSAIDWNTNTINYDPPGRVQTNKRRPTVPLNKQAREALKKAQMMGADRIHHRVQREACEEHPQGYRGRGAAVGCALLTACLPPHRWRVHGRGRPTDVNDFAVSWTYHYKGDRDNLCPLLTELYERCCGRFGLVGCSLNTRSAFYDALDWKGVQVNTPSAS